MRKAKQKISPVIILIVLGFCTQINFAVAQPVSGPYQSKEIRYATAWGFLYGQSLSCSIIRKKFPELELAIKSAELRFDLSYPNAFIKIDKAVMILLKDEYLTTKDALQKALLESFNEADVDWEIAVGFIDLVENRSKGEIDSPILETILEICYADQPEGEFAAGFTQTFSTSQHPKAKGRDWSVKVPKSWLASEGERPNIIQKFRSQNGKGMENLMLMVYSVETSKELILGRTNPSKLLSEKKMRNDFPKEARFVSYQQLIIEGEPAAEIQYTQIAERMDFKIKQQVIMYKIYFDGYYYIIFLSVASENIYENLGLRIRKFERLFKMMINSIVIRDRYL